MVVRARGARSMVGVSALLAGMVLAGAPVRAEGLPAGCAGAVTAGNDTITCSDNLTAGSVLDAGEGDDTIVIEGDVLEGAVVSGGVGKDKISARNVGRFLCPAAELGADDVNGGVLDGGPGDDEITVGGQDRPAACDAAMQKGPGGNVGRHGAVVGGPGNDVLRIGSVGYVFQPDPAKPETAAGAHGGRVSGDDGDDTITIDTVSLGERPPSGTAPDAPDAVFGGAGKDTISVHRTVGAADIYGDAYAPIPDAAGDTITVDEMTGGWVHGGPGDDLVTGGTLGGAGAALWGDDGNDTIKAGDMYLGASVFGGDGNDALSATSLNKDPSTRAATLIGGNGDDKIDVGTVGTTDSVVLGDGTDPTAGADPNSGTGKDTITAIANNGSIFGGNDDDTITIDVNNNLVDGSAGTNTCTIKGQGSRGSVTACEQK
ncbi:hypothetical protein [Nocardia ninae]|nr:hypothetical protein [Nocardia ninae]